MDQYGTHYDYNLHDLTKSADHFVPNFCRDLPRLKENEYNVPSKAKTGRLSLVPVVPLAFKRRSSPAISDSYSGCGISACQFRRNHHIAYQLPGEPSDERSHSPRVSSAFQPDDVGECSRASSSEV